MGSSSLSRGLRARTQRREKPRMMKKSVPEFCGVRPVGVTSVGGVRQSTPARRGRWLRQARQLGEAA
jgi:hypothetical protein